MTRTSRRAGRRPTAGRRRGVGFLWFLLVAIPFFFIAAFIAVDISRIYLAQREAANAAEAAALAGGFAFRPGTATVDPAAATVEANATLTVAEQIGALAHVDVVDARVDVAGNDVTVTLDYNVRGLVFVRAISGVFNLGQPDTFDGTLARTAFLCRSIVDGAGPDELCTRPLR